MIFRLYGLIKFGLMLILGFVIYVVYFSSDEFYYFVVDTLTFENASSMGHLLAWIEAFNQMVIAPLGSGLATSGNASGVTDELRIGGENQFLIFGVQLGVLGMLLYIAILATGIWTAIQAFRYSKDTHLARIAFVAATVKVGLLLPLFTFLILMTLFFREQLGGITGDCLGGCQQLSELIIIASSIILLLESIM